MNNERWARAQELFHSALERDPEARQAFLNTACSGDSDLRHQLEQLLAKEPEAGNFLETPAARYRGPPRKSPCSLPASRSDRIGSRLHWAPAAWVKFIARTTLSSAAMSRLRLYHLSSRAIQGG